MKSPMNADKRGFKQDEQDLQNNLKLRTSSFLFYPANPVHPVKNLRLSTKICG
jgi:hypothetical protein